MKLTVVPQEQVARRSASRWGDFRQDETLADLIRAEVTARGSCLRWTALRRLEQALGNDEADLNRARLKELCDGLEHEGDLTASSGGVLNVSPVRAIEIQEGVHRVVCSLPSHRLRAHLPGTLDVDGLRRLHRFEPNMEPEVGAALQALGGTVVSPQAWAGLELTPIANSAWLVNLDQRLEWQPEAAGSLERDGALDWQGLTQTTDGPRWRRNPDEPCRLWRARTSYGRWIWAWGTAEGTPSTEAFVTLFADEANRTLFALAREADQPVSASVARDDAFAHVRLREWLPRAEYRYLSALASTSRIENQQQWSIPLSRVDGVFDTLTRRLGLDIKEEVSA